MDLPQESINPICVLLNKYSVILRLDGLILNRVNREYHEGLVKSIIADAEVLPLFEEKFAQHRQKRYASLVTNELLRCRWGEYVKRIDPRAPIYFPSVNDFHFSKCEVRYDPKESICNRVTNRLHLSIGPGVDKYGQMPVPDELHLRKTVYIKPRDKKIEKNIMVNANKKRKSS